MNDVVKNVNEQKYSEIENFYLCDSLTKAEL